MYTQSAKKSNTATTTKKKFFYSQPDNAVIFDTEIRKTAKDLYHILVAKANIQTHEVYISIKELAQLLDRAESTTQRKLRELQQHGIISIIHRKSPHNNKWNLINCFVIHGRHAPKYVGSEFVPLEDTCEKRPKMTPGGRKNEALNTQEFINQELIKETLKREAKPTQEVGEGRKDKEGQEIEVTQVEVLENLENPSFPEQEGETSLEAQPTEDPNPSTKAERVYDLSGIPDIMLPTAQYWLMKTGRALLTDDEKALLSEMANTQYPTRVQKEIDTAIERFLATNRKPTQMSFNYIAKCLDHQPSYSAEKKGTKRNKKGRKKVVEAEQEQLVQQVNAEATEADTLPEPEVPEATMTVEEAKKIINEYEPALIQEPPMPRALQEWFDKLAQAQQEAFDRYAMSLPQTEDGSPIWPDYETDEEAFKAGSLTLEEYLRVKFPNATAEELTLDYVDERTLAEMTKACEIDCACSHCDNPEYCLLPDGVNKKRAYPMISLDTDLRGHKQISLRYGLCLKCKHDYGKGKPDPDFARKVEASGIAEKDMHNTFAAYDDQAAGDEATIMKAFAIRAAQEKSNLILAGKAGTGKTHLAIAIALDAMRAGRKALVKSMPELLDEICLAHQEHNDPFGLMMKYKSVSCLVLDDFGKERTSEARLDYLYQIIDYRYEHGLQTIITTNAYDMEGLKNKWNADKIEPLVSRILENGEWVTIHKCKNYRFQKRATRVPAAPEAEEPTVTTVQPVRKESRASHVIEGKIINRYETAELGVVTVRDITSDFKRMLGEEEGNQPLSETPIASNGDTASESALTIAGEENTEESEYEIGSDWLPEEDEKDGEDIEAEAEEYASKKLADTWTETSDSTDTEDGFVSVGSMFEERPTEPSKPIEQRDEEGFLLDEDGLPTMQGIGAEQLSNSDYIRLAEYLMAKRERIEAERKRARAESSSSTVAPVEVMEAVENDATTSTPAEATEEDFDVDKWLDEMTDMYAEMQTTEEEADADDILDESELREYEAYQRSKEEQSGADVERTSKGTVIYVPHYDDGLDDDEEDLRLYGSTGIPGIDYDPNEVEDEDEDEDDYDRQLE